MESISMKAKYVVTHNGGAHKDDFLACCVWIAKQETRVFRREPTEQELRDPGVCVIDIGHEHDPQCLNFDHHQFAHDHPATCSLSLVLEYFGLYEDGKRFCEWLETAEYFDSKGAIQTARWLGVERGVLLKLNSPIDISLLKAFAREIEWCETDMVWQMMKMIGTDLVEYIESLHDRMEFIDKHAELWTLDGEGGTTRVLFMPRTDPLPEEPSLGLGRYIEEHPEEITGLVYPDRRGDGYGLSRFHDHPGFDFCQLKDEEDVHFAHARGFLAKTSSSDLIRLKELLELAMRAPF
ncbi:MAG: MYG1 family protein [Opitutales bacterium]|nr:MYG1 family protein [Opitutales bacterium]